MTALLVLLMLVSPVRYDRRAWPHWIGRCPDVRQRVLIEESRRPATLSIDGCRVLSGEWFDVYTGESITSPAALDVDHLIPLAAAHRAGGWRWTRAQRQAYANALDDPDHLVAVSAAANRAKGDKGPSAWLPPRRASRCWYGTAYARVAETWHLTLSRADQTAIKAMTRTCESH